jgi:hypothetical protein
VSEIVIDWPEFEINSSTWKAALKVHKKRDASQKLGSVRAKAEYLNYWTTSRIRRFV